MHSDDFRAALEQRFDEPDGRDWFDGLFEGARLALILLAEDEENMAAWPAKTRDRRSQHEDEAERLRLLASKLP